MMSGSGDVAAGWAPWPGLAPYGREMSVGGLQLL